MATFVYIDETGSAGTGGKTQPLLTLAAVLVDEKSVRPLAKRLEEIAWQHLGWLPADFEFHGHEIWNAMGHWASKTPPELIAVYTDLIGLLEELDLHVSHASIHKQRLHDRYSGDADSNAYGLALQFLLEKVDAYGSGLKVLVADEAKEHQLRAIRMVADLQSWGSGEVPGRKLQTIIDSLHFVTSHASPGVQMADLVAYVLQRSRRSEHHPEAQAAIDGLRRDVTDRTPTWRNPWPAGG